MGRLRWPTYSCKVASMLALTVYPIRQPRQRRQIFKCKQLVLGCIQMSFEETLGIIAWKWALLQMSQEVYRSSKFSRHPTSCITPESELALRQQCNRHFAGSFRDQQNIIWRATSTTIRTIWQCENASSCVLPLQLLRPLFAAEPTNLCPRKGVNLSQLDKIYQFVPIEE